MVRAERTPYGLKRPGRLGRFFVPGARGARRGCDSLRFDRTAGLIMLGERRSEWRGHRGAVQNRGFFDHD